MPLEMKPSNPLSFVPMDSNKFIENFQATRRTFAQGAFSDEARIELAKAVEKKRQFVQMDSYHMEILYYETHCVARPSNGAGLPMGNYPYKDLKDRLVGAE